MCPAETALDTHTHTHTHTHSFMPQSAPYVLRYCSHAGSGRALVPAGKARPVRRHKLAQLSAGGGPLPPWDNSVLLSSLEWLFFLRTCPHSCKASVRVQEGDRRALDDDKSEMGTSLLVLPAHTNTHVRTHTYTHLTTSLAAGGWGAVAARRAERKGSRAHCGEV